MLKPILTTLILFLSVILPTAAKEQFIYTQISQKEGLISTVNCIYKEKDGDVWIGTPNGLYSFNGNMLHNHQDSALVGKRIHQVGVDRNDDLWVLTNQWPARKRGREFEIIRPKGAENENTPFLCMCQDEEGIWFGSNRKIFRYTFSDSSLNLFKDLSDMPAFLVQNINLLDENTLLCSSHNGIMSVDIRTGETSESPFSLFNEVTSTLIDSKGNIWISFYNNGIAVFEKGNRLIRRFSTSNSSLSNDVVLCMTERDSSIWVGTDGGGINIINPKTGDIRVLSHVAGDPSSLPAHSIKSIYVDGYGNIWAGSIREGLIRISQSGMKTYSDSHIGLKTGLSNPTVLCFYQDNRSEHIWIGTDGEGINRFDPATGEFTHYPRTLRTKIVSIATYSDKELVLSSYADRMWIFNTDTGNIRPLHINDPEINYLLRYAGRSLNLANESNGDLLLISNTVSRYDKSSGKCIRLNFDIGSRSNGNLLTIQSTEEGLWMHDYYNIYLLPEGGSQIIRKGHTNRHVIKCGYLDSDGTIWLATDHGLCRFNTANGTFSHVETTLLNTATSVVCDRHSRVWVGTDNGLYAYLKAFDSFTLFGSSDGAGPNEYLSKPHLLSREGDVYMGGVQGMLCIDKDFQIDTTDRPSIRLYSIKADNEEIAAVRGETCRIPRNSKRVEIVVTTQEKDIFREKVYRFMIPDIGVSYEMKSPVLTLQRLNISGSHDVLVSCTKRSGEWSEPERLVTLDIPKPWYHTWWFISSVSVFALLLVTAIFLTAMKRKDNKLKMAMKEQEQKIYEEKVRMLINISHELRTPLTLIMAPLKRLLSDINPQDKQHPTLSRIYRQSLRMRDLLNMVLDLRKMEVGKSDLKLEQNGFNQWLLDSIEDIVDEGHVEGIEIVTRLDPDVGQADFDKVRCDTVLTNILMNAVKHSHRGDIITISTELTGEGMIRTSISDQGPGLKDIDTSMLFTRFYQSRNEQYGSGIGLSYSKILVELHGGRIGACNNADKGATFWWEIPVCGIKEHVPAKAYLNELIGYNPADGMIAEGASFKTSDKKLMLVDDNPDLLDFLREAMNMDFCEIKTAGGGKKAFELISDGFMPDVIVSDVNMPEGDGYTLCNRLKSDERFMHIPIILLTARGEGQSQSEVYKVGADAYMGKPFEIETLMELIRNLLRRKENIRKRYLDNEGVTTTGYGSEEEGFILKLNAIISAHISDPDLDQQILCRELGVSRASLFNKMKSITGAGAKEYITRIRLDKAKSLIENTDLSIAEISDLTGFASQSYFSTAFKNFTGMTPSQYKKQKRESNS